MSLQEMTDPFVAFAVKENMKLPTALMSLLVTPAVLLGCSAPKSEPKEPQPVDSDAKQAPPVALQGTALSLEGPFPSLDAYCKEFERVSIEKASAAGTPTGDAKPRCGLGVGSRELDTTGASVKPIGTFKFAHNLGVAADSAMPGVSVRFAVHTASGWYVDSPTNESRPWAQVDEEGPHLQHTTQWSPGALTGTVLNWSVVVRSHFQGHGAPSASSSSNAITLRCDVGGEQPRCAFEESEKKTVKDLAIPEPPSPVKAPATAPTTFSSADVIGDWVMSDEDSTYRPANYKKTWPVSRFRGTFSLKKDGSASWYVLAPNDAHFTIRGTWTLKGSAVEFVVTKSAKGIKKGAKRTLSLASASKDKLLVSKDGSDLHNYLGAEDVSSD